MSQQCWMWISDWWVSSAGWGSHIDESSVLDGDLRLMSQQCWMWISDWWVSSAGWGSHIDESSVLDGDLRLMGQQCWTLMSQQCWTLMSQQCWALMSQQYCMVQILIIYPVKQRHELFTYVLWFLPPWGCNSVVSLAVKSRLIMILEYHICSVKNTWLT